MIALLPFTPIEAKKKTIKTPIINQMVTINTNVPGVQVYADGQLVLASTPGTINLTLQGTITPDKKHKEAAYAEAKRVSSKKLTFVKDGYIQQDFILEPSIFESKIGFTQFYQFDWPKVVNINLAPIANYANEYDKSITNQQASERVSRNSAGKTDLERTIIRWFFDSDPQGARIFWRVISSVPAEVKNTNETYLMTTPYEETRSFNILGLTYENSRDVQIEVKIIKSGYEPQVKRFNVRQAIDQQEISSFFMLVKKEE